MIVGTVLSLVVNLGSRGVSLVGKIPATLPSLSLSMPDGIGLDDLVQDAFGIFIVSFGSGIVTARSFGAKNRYRVDPNRELIGFGAANIISGLFGGFPVTGADSRTAINDAVGGRTQVAGARRRGSVDLCTGRANRCDEVPAGGRVGCGHCLRRARSVRCQGTWAPLADEPH